MRYGLTTFFIFIQELLLKKAKKTKLMNEIKMGTVQNIDMSKIILRAKINNSK